MMKYSLLALLFFGSLAAQAQIVDFNGYPEFGSCNAIVAQLTENSDIVYVFTAGHCVRGVMDKTNIHKKIINSPFPANTAPFVYSLDKSHSLRIHLLGVVLAGFGEADVAILEVQEKAQDFVAADIRLPLVSRDVISGTKVMVNDVVFDRQLNCATENNVQKLIYASWKFNSTTRLDKQCSIRPGWSGAGVVATESGNLLGVVSATNDTGDCTDFCEVSAKGKKIPFINQAYFTNFSFLKNCVIDNGKLDPTSCPL